MDPSAGRNPYTILGVPTFATQREVTAAYRRLARRFHPDVSGRQDSAVRMQEINWAYGVLRDPDARQAFDRMHERAARARGRSGYAARPPGARPFAEPAGGFRFLGGTADRAIVGSLVAVGTLAASMLLGLQLANLGAPVALAVGCWIGSVPNPRLSSQHGLAIGALIGLFSAASFSASLTDSGTENNLLAGFICCAPFTVLLGASVGAMVGTLAGWIRRAGLLMVGPAGEKE